tara:strand:+ start:20588 stop:23185 length:2598 start_codon:yes stop_codon:yes gene_type:complete
MSVTDSLLNSSFFGRDGYRYWIGKVPFSKTINEGYNWGERVPVRILGYHTEDRSILPDKDLPTAIIKRPTSMGQGNNASSGIVGGELVSGFFADGDDAQQPVIDGIYGYFDKDAPNVSSAEYQDANSGINPFDSSFPYTDNLPAWRVASEGKSPDLKSNTNKQGKESNPSGEFKTTVVSDSTSYSNFVPSNLNTWEMYNLMEEFSGPNNCGTDTISRIQVEISKVASILNGVKKYYATYVLGTVNKVYDFAGQINKIIDNIAAVLRTLIQRVRNWVLKQIRTLVSNAIDLILGDVAKDLADSILAKILDIIFCIFQITIDELPGLIGDFLAALLDKIAAAPICSAEKFINALINNVLGALQGALNGAMEEISKYLDGVLDIGGAIMDVIDQILGIIGFLCLTKNCSEVTKFNSSPWGGPTKQQKDNFNKFLSELQIPDPTTGALGWLEEAGLGDTTGPSACDIVGGDECTPPTVSIFGGNPVAEALASSVISKKGNIIGVLLSQKGLGYKYPPFVAFDDPCNYGSGGAGYAEIDPIDGGLTGVIITNPGWGYIDVPDGSDNDNPDDDAQKPIGGGDDEIIIDLPDGGGDDDATDGGGTVDPGLPDDGDGGNGGDGGSGGGGGDEIVTVPVVGCLDKISVITTGYGYAQDDTFIVTPPMPGLLLEGRYTDSGQLVEIVIKGEQCGFVEIPDITINSKTGNGVRLRPSIVFTEASEFTVEEQSRYSSSTLSVIQCTSKTQELVGYVNGQPYYGPYHVHKGVKMVGAAHSDRPHALIYDTVAESLSKLGSTVIRNTTSSSESSSSTVQEAIDPITPSSNALNIPTNTDVNVQSTSTNTPTPSTPTTPSTPSPSPSPPSGGGGGYGGGY